MASKRKKESLKDIILKRWKIITKKTKKESSKTEEKVGISEKIKKHSTFSTAEVVTIVIITAFISLLMGLVISNSVITSYSIHYTKLYDVKIYY